jgi:hypothetical protein
MNSSGASLFSGTKASDLAPLSRADRMQKLRDIIAANMDGGFSPDCALLMADMENGISAGLLTATFQATNSLYNRHAGSRNPDNSDWAGADPTDTGHIFYASAKDTDLRVFDSLEQSVRDFIGLMRDGLYTEAWDAATRNDITAYISAVAAVPYSAQVGYQAALISRARSLGLLS